MMLFVTKISLFVFLLCFSCPLWRSHGCRRYLLPTHPHTLPVAFQLAPKIYFRHFRYFYILGGGGAGFRKIGIFLHGHLGAIPLSSYCPLPSFAQWAILRLQYKRRFSQVLASEDSGFLFSKNNQLVTKATNHEGVKSKSWFQSKLCFCCSSEPLGSFLKKFLARSRFQQCPIVGD